MPEKTATEVIPTKQIWVAKPFIVAYVVIVGFTLGLLVNRRPQPEAIPAMAPVGQTGHEGEREAREPPLWLQLFRPSQATARLFLRAGIPQLSIADGSALARQRRSLVFYWTGRTDTQPQTLFQTMLPFLRELAPAAVKAEEPPVALDPALPTPLPSGGISPPEPNGAAPASEPSAPKGVQPGAGKESGPAATKPAVNMGLPLVGIYHTHDWESYLSEFPGLTVKTVQDLNQVVSYDHKKRSVVELGDALAVNLRDEGIATVHAPFKHQDLGYDFAYRASRDTVKRILKEAPTARILLDLHRDGVLGLNSTTTVLGKPVAKIRCIIGQYQEPHWEQNKAFCDQITARLEAMYPGMTLPTRVQNDTYNQDLLTGAILLEIGNALNRYDEAERAVYYLSKALAAAIRAGEYPK